MSEISTQLANLAFPKKLERENFFQSNEISRSIYSCSILARKIIAFSSSLVEMKTKKIFWNNQNIIIPVWTATFSISDFFKKFNLSNAGKNYENIKKTLLECQNAKIILERENEFVSYNWFYSVMLNSANDVIEMTFSPDVGSAIYDFKAGYTAMRFRMIGEFKSIYTFRFYEIAVSFIGNKGKNGNKKGQWYFEYSIEELKIMFGLSKDSYPKRTNAFILNVIQNPIKELNKINTEFEISIEKIKQGRNVMGIRFLCSEKYESNPKFKIKKSDSLEIKQKKKVLLNEEEFFKKHDAELKMIIDGLKLVANELELNDGGFSLNVKAKQNLIQKYPEEWKLYHKD